MTCGSPSWRLLPPCISVLSFIVFTLMVFSILMIARSVDPALLPSDNKNTMGPGLAVVSTSGSILDDVRTKFLLPRPLDDSVRFTVRLRLVAIYWMETHVINTTRIGPTDQEGPEPVWR